MTLSSSSTKGKRRKLEEELRSAESDINRKEEELESAQQNLRQDLTDIRRWEGLLLTVSEQYADLLTRWDLEREDAKLERQQLKLERQQEEAKLERQKAESNVKVAEARVQVLKDELKELKEQWNITKQLVGDLVPDASEYFQAVASLGAPSDLVSHHTWWKAQRLDRNVNPLFLCFVPPEAQPTMPLELAEEVFSQFLVDAKEVVVDQHDCAFTQNLCLLVGQELENEHEMAREFRKMLSDYLGGGLGVSITCSRIRLTYPTDGCLIILDHMALLAQLKLDPKTTLFQAMQFYAVHVADREKASLWPCFLIELVGTCIRISGLAYFEKVACQPLTPFMHCYINYFDRSDMNTLCRAMRALRTGVHKLYSRGRAALTRNKNIPYHLGLPGLEFQKRMAGKLMFVMRELESRELKVVKFCRQYGVSVHEAWAEQGLAPKLIKHNRERDGWYVIEMEYLDPVEWKSVHEWSKRPSTSISIARLQVTIWEALTQAHEIIVNGSKTVHGDMRSPNIMVRERDEGGQASFEVKFIDFDWSGIVGETIYPNFMNMDVRWHPEAGPGKQLFQEHDRHFLGALLVQH